MSWFHKQLPYEILKTQVDKDKDPQDLLELLQIIITSTSFFNFDSVKHVIDS